jgi:hypothetical protein
MLNLNRRHTEALEKTARAKKRLADAEETIARHLGDYLRDEGAEETKPAAGVKKATPPKNPPAKK